MLLLGDLWSALACMGAMGSAKGREAGGKSVCESREVGLTVWLRGTAARTGRKSVVAPPLAEQGCSAPRRRSRVDLAPSARAALRALTRCRGATRPPRRDLWHRGSRSEARAADERAVAGLREARVPASL